MTTLPRFVRDFADKIAERHGIEPSVLLATADSRRHPRLMRARHELRAITFWTLGLTASECARMFGVDRSTLTNSVRAYEARLLP